MPEMECQQQRVLSAVATAVTKSSNDGSSSRGIDNVPAMRHVNTGRRGGLLAPAPVLGLYPFEHDVRSFPGILFPGAASGP